MTKENVLFGIIGLILGLIVGFAVTNSINRGGYGQTIAQNSNAAVGALPPQINNQVVRDQPAGGGNAAGGAAMPGVQQAIDRAKNEPSNSDAQIAAGEMFYRIQRFDEAIQYFERANAVKPDDLNVLVKLGNSYFDTGKYDQAEKWYTAALKKNPNDVNVRTDLGLTFYLRQPRDIERAVSEYRKSLETNPNHELTLQNLAAALKEKGDAQALNETLARLETVNPQNPVVKQLRGQ
jgi:tetratricopeptide (TPR) repeat protein